MPLFFFSMVFSSTNKWIASGIRQGKVPIQTLDRTAREQKKTILKNAIWNTDPIPRCHFLVFITKRPTQLYLLFCQIGQFYFNNNCHFLLCLSRVKLGGVWPFEYRKLLRKLCRFRRSAISALFSGFFFFFYSLTPKVACSLVVKKHFVSQIYFLYDIGELTWSK